MNAVRLSRGELQKRGGGIEAPIRIVHLGLGAFHRAHQAWYTSMATDADEWGIAAFTGRSSLQADLLAPQDGLYTLTERDAGGDRVGVITSIVEALDGSRIGRLIELLRNPEVAVVTLTITESGYRLRANGTADLQDPVVARDLDALRAAWSSGDFAAAAPEAALTRLLVGMEVRRRAGNAAIAIVPCDNLPHNGKVTASALRELAAAVDPTLVPWIDQTVTFIDTSVDRITPRLDDPPTEAIAAAGWLDDAPVVTEPYSAWVLAGRFPAGRPAWESAGARFVNDIEPWENRKLWLLNGAHSLLAFRGMVAGHRTVSDAIADPACRRAVEEFWSEACALIPADVDTVDYRNDLIARFANTRIVHSLEQIAADSSLKVRVRFAAVAERTRAAGGDARASAAAIAGWIRWVDAGHSVPDAAEEDVAAAASSNDPAAGLVRLVSPKLADDSQFLARVRDALPVGIESP